MFSNFNSMFDTFLFWFPSNNLSLVRPIFFPTFNTMFMTIVHRSDSLFSWNIVCKSNWIMGGTRNIFLSCSEILLLKYIIMLPTDMCYSCTCMNFRTSYMTIWNIFVCSFDNVWKPNSTESFKIWICCSITQSYLIPVYSNTVSCCQLDLFR